jgi:hypothetical protein
MMNPWNHQLSAQIVHRNQREGVEVIESPFEREWQPGLISRVILALWRALHSVGNQPRKQLTKEERMA